MLSTSRATRLPGFCRPFTLALVQPRRAYTSPSSTSGKPPAPHTTSSTSNTRLQSSSQGASPTAQQSLAAQDAELLARMEERSGDGGAAGLELENGELVAMKRGVKANMFRYI